jgi:hypothetical protein
MYLIAAVEQRAQDGVGRGGLDADEDPLPVGAQAPASTRSRVDFPLPFLPSRRTSRPAGTARLTSRTIHGWRSPYRLPTASRRAASRRASPSRQSCPVDQSWPMGKSW